MKSIESQLAKKAKGGDRSAFNELVQRYSSKIYNLAYRMLGNVQESEDVVQETFLRVYKNLASYNPTHKFSTWIYRIGTNLCIDRLRKRKPIYSLDMEREDGEGVDGYAVIASDEKTPEMELILSETQLSIREAIQSLPDKYKSVVILKYFQDLSLQEISEILDMPVTTVKTRIHRGREYLRRKLQHQQL
ncbi:RNA polymerase sigma factor SigW [Longirhabdus pacifica]|uniref:RNA polymerase sigma factor SigW n=1 Tax=Longirhabdus pacifica TaxID=2305227 RepID=UPI001008A6DC|nr:RNA polymerase sigma factor SigW [Longirhabdus pacifica]